MHTLIVVDITYDPAKDARNIRERQLSFARASEFDFATALVEIDNRKEYGEVRYVALGLVGERVHALVFTETETGIRVISFRKANKREVRRHEQSR